MSTMPVCHWMDGLSVRVGNAFLNCNIESREQAMKAYLDGTLRPSHPRNYGWATHKEVAKWLGLPEPQKSRRTMCPHCGKFSY